MEGDNQSYKDFKIPLLYSRRGIKMINCNSNSLLWTIFIECYPREEGLSSSDMRQYQYFPNYNKHLTSMLKFKDKYDLVDIKEDDFESIEDKIPYIKLNVYELNYAVYKLTNDVILPEYAVPIYQSKHKTDPDPNTITIDVLKVYNNEWMPDYNNAIISSILSRLSITPPEDTPKRKYIYLNIENKDKFTKLAQIRTLDQIKEETTEKPLEDSDVDSDTD